MKERFQSESPGVGWTYAGEGRWTFDETKGDPDRQTSLRIAVIGGGPGGLFASYILNQRMPLAHITIYEANDHCGGKICTSEFGDGTPYESGVAELYEYLGPGGHDPMRLLFEADLGLETVNIAGGAVVLRNELLRDLDEVEEKYGADTRRRIQHFHKKMVDLMPLEKYSQRWQPDNSHPWANLHFRECIEKELAVVDGVDEVAREYIETAVHSDLATESHTCNGLNGIKNILMDNDSYMQLYHIVGGIERVVDQLLNVVKADVKTCHRVCRIVKSGADPVRLSINEGDPPEIITSEPDIAIAGLTTPSEVISPYPSGGKQPHPQTGKKYTVYILEVDDNTLTERSAEFDAIVVCLPNHYLRTIKWEGLLAKGIHDICAHYDLPAHYLRVSLLFDEKWWANLKIPGEFWMMDMYNGCCCYDESTRWDAHESMDRRQKDKDSQPVDIDEELWEEILAILPREEPENLPHLAGVIDDGKTKVMLVDGDRIKIEYNMDFVEGGNGVEDPNLCAHDELYIDAHIDPKEWAYICYHEAVEMRDMIDNNTPYEIAHERANEVEKILRIRGIPGERGHILSFLLAGGDALLLCSSNQSDDCIVEHVLQSLPTFMREDAQDHFIQGKVSRYVGSINAQPGGWPAEELRGEHIPEPKEHPGVFLVGDYFFDSTLNAALMSANVAIELLLEYFGVESAPVTEAIELLEAKDTGV